MTCWFSLTPIWSSTALLGYEDSGSECLEIRYTACCLLSNINWLFVNPVSVLEREAGIYPSPLKEAILSKVFITILLYILLLLLHLQTWIDRFSAGRCWRCARNLLTYLKTNRIIQIQIWRSDGNVNPNPRNNHLYPWTSPAPCLLVDHTQRW